MQAAAKEYGTAYGREDSDNDDDNEIRLETEEDRRRRAMEDMYMDANIPKPEVGSQYDWCYCLHAAGVVQLCHCLERLCKQTTLACTIMLSFGLACMQSLKLLLLLYSYVQICIPKLFTFSAVNPYMSK